DFLITEGNAIQMGNLALGTHQLDASPIRVFKMDTSWFIESDLHLQVMEMSTQQLGVLHAGQRQPLQTRSLYQWEGGAFIIKYIYEDAALTYKEEQDETLAENLPNVVKINITDQEGQLVAERYVKLASFNPAWHPFTHNGKNYSFTYGPRAETLPFELY